MSRNIWNGDNFASLAAAERRAVEARAAEGESGPEYLNRVGAGVSDVADYARQDSEADAKFFEPFFRLSLQFPRELRVARALQIREDAAGLGLDTAEVDALIAQFKA